MSSANLRWLSGNGPHALSDGVSFGMPWPRGLYQPGQKFVIEAKDAQWPLDSRELAYWADGSLRWTAHSVSGNIDYSDEYTVKGVSHPPEPTASITIEQQELSLSVTSQVDCILGSQHLAARRFSSNSISMGRRSALRPRWSRRLMRKSTERESVQ